MGSWRADVWALLPRSAIKALAAIKAIAVLARISDTNNHANLLIKSMKY